MPQEDAIREAVSTYFHTIREADEENWTHNFAHNAVCYDPVGAPPNRGHNELRRFFQNINDMFEKVALHEEEMFIAGDGAAVKWRGEGVGRNGREVEFSGIDVFKINDRGKIQQLWAYWDPQSIMAEITDESG